MNKSKNHYKGEVRTLDELRSQKEILQRQIKKETSSLKSSVASAANPQAGLQTIQRLISVVSAIKLGYTGYKAYKNISGYIARFKKKD